ncbi:uncharacterized protein TRIADDRAFT_33578, partial [Trichoplax adhaerens]
LSIMSVDLGSEWIKVAIVKPGVPMEIALNAESKRKSPAAVSIKDGERLFGDSALAVSVKSPKNAYIYVLDILGKKFDNPLVELYKKRFPFYELEKDEKTGAVRFRHDSETTYTPEEIIGMILQHARQIAADFTGQPIDNAVITVPPYFNQAERNALYVAANISGLNILQLMNDNAAVGLNFGMFRRSSFGSKEKIFLFYDMGSSSTSATVASYKTVGRKETGLSETLPQLHIMGVGFDRTLGGKEMDLRLRDYLLKEFKKQGKTKDDITKSPRAMAKLLKEAHRVKKVLSANADHFARIENLYNGIDFRTKVTREEFEKLCSDLFKKVSTPIRNALRAANVVLDEIEQVILIGGSTRVPKVQSELLKAIKRDELGKSLNTDEAAAMGSVYQAASLGKGFRVKKFLIKDSNPYAIQISYDRKSETSSEAKKRIQLFPRGNPIPQRKVVTINKLTRDFHIDVDYVIPENTKDNVVRMHGNRELLRYQLSGVTDIFSKYVDKAESKGIKVHFRLDDHGLFHLDSAEAIFETKSSLDGAEESTFSKIGSNILNFFSGSKDDNGDPEVTETQNTTANATTTDTNNTTNGTATKDASPKLVVIKEPITITVEHLDMELPPKEAIKASIDKLEELTRRDVEKKAREIAMNSLESYIVDTQDKLYSEAFEAVSTEDERSKLRETLSESSEWLYEDGFNADTKTYKQRLESLKEQAKDIFFRVKERKLRPKALKALKSELNHTVHFINLMKNLTSYNSTADAPFTESEFKEYSELYNETKNWMKTVAEKEDKLVPTENPTILSNDINNKASKLRRETSYLVEKLQRYTERIEAKKKAEKEAKEAAKKAAKEAAKKAENDKKTTTEGKDQDKPDDTAESQSDNENSKVNSKEEKKGDDKQENADEKHSEL